MSDLKAHVQSIADNLSNPDLTGLNDDDDQVSAFDYLKDALDIEYIVNIRGEYLGARVLVAFGGPNIWINTRTGFVDGSWWDEHAEAPFKDELGLDEALSELWSCRYNKGFKMIYIQRKDNKGLETVDEFETRKEAQAMLKEYQLSDRYGYYYLSSRCCKDWKA